MRDKSTIKVITWLTAIILGGLIVIVPLGYFIVSYHYVEGILETEAEDIATTITQQIININPELWEFNHTRLNGYITLRPKDKSAEIRRILNIKNELVIEYADKLGSPVITRSFALKDTGVVVGRLEISRTLRPLLIWTGFVTLFVSLFASGIFILLRIFPIRMMYQSEAALQQSEERFRAITQFATDAIVSIDSSGVIVFWNTSAERLFGYPVDEVIGKSLTIIMPHQFREAHQKGVSKLTSTGESSLIGKTIEIVGLKKDGGEFPIELTLSTWKINKGTFFTAIIRDITRRKHAEERLMSQSREIELRNVELSTLYKISSAINRTIDMNDLFSNILNTIIEIDMLKVERKGGILLIDGDKMNLVSHLGHPKSFLNMHGNMTVNDCLCGLAVRTGEIIISKNSHTDCNHTIAYPEMTPHGHIIIPLKAIDKILGVLYLYLPVDFDIDERTIQTFIAIGNQIGIAINNCLLHEKAKMLSLYDPLTKVANRNLMNVEIEKNFERSKRLKGPFSIIMTDIDNFKKYNDTYGHTYGDRLLVEVAKILSNEVRTVDLVARYGGEEFLIILPDTELKGAYDVAERIRRSVEAMTAITLSLGVISYFPEILNWEELIKKADTALYRAKQKGKNRVEVSKTGVNGE
jgi:diguanylate cyclase (GGDEF)-like protein/PAS domain S-box-containing protein